jgi:acetyltransferase-like isoleucine patch superfamily enzyme
VIEKDAFIGPGVVVLADVQIGQGAIITAGSVVNALRNDDARESGEAHSEM